MLRVHVNDRHAEHFRNGKLFGLVPKAAGREKLDTGNIGVRHHAELGGSSEDLVRREWGTKFPPGKSVGKP